MPIMTDSKLTFQVDPESNAIWLHRVLKAACARLNISLNELLKRINFSSCTICIFNDSCGNGAKSYVCDEGKRQWFRAKGLNQTVAGGVRNLIIGRISQLIRESENESEFD